MHRGTRNAQKRKEWGRQGKKKRPEGVWNFAKEREGWHKGCECGANERETWCQTRKERQNGTIECL